LTGRHVSWSCDQLLLPFTGDVFDLREQCVGWVSPEEPRVEPEVLKLCTADWARDLPPLHPTPQSRVMGDGIRAMPHCARTTDLRGLPYRYQSTVHSSTARLRHVPQHLLGATQSFGKLGPITAGQFQVEVSDR
jgi:hypothetical protein